MAAADFVTTAPAAVFPALIAACTAATAVVAATCPTSREGRPKTVDPCCELMVAVGLKAEKEKMAACLFAVD